MIVFYARKKVNKLLLIACSLFLLVGYIKLNGSPPAPHYQDKRGDEWNILEGWVAPAELDGSRHTCKKLLMQTGNNVTVESFTLGIGGMIRLADARYSVSEYLSEMRRNLTAMRVLFRSCVLVHALGSIQEADFMHSHEFISFLSTDLFDVMREAGINSLTLAAPELASEGVQQRVPQLMRAARSAGIHLTGIAGGVKQQEMLDAPQGIRIGVLSYCTYKGCEENSELAYRPSLYSSASHYDIQILRAKGANLVVVNVNWGLSTLDSSRQYSEVVSHQLAMAGADVIMGQNPVGGHGHGLYGAALVVYSTGVMFGRGGGDNGILSSRFDANEMSIFLFYRVHYRRLVGKRFEYIKVDKENSGERTGWVEVCSSQDLYCVECVDLREPHRVSL